MRTSAYQASLAALRDNVVVAIEHRQAGVVQEGLDVYRRLLEVVLDEHVRFSESSHAQPDPDLSLGREWDQLMRDLAAIVDRVAASGSVLLWVDTLSWLSDVSRLAAGSGLVRAFRMTLSLFESAWRQELAEPRANSAARQDALLLRFYELAAFDAMMSSSAPGVVEQARAAYVSSFMNVVKAAIDAEAPEAAAAATDYFLEALSPRGERLPPLVQAAVLALNGWILHRFDHGHTEETFTLMRNRIAAAISHQQGLLGTLASFDRLGSSLGVSWWELDRRGPISSGVMRIGEYAVLSAVIAASSTLRVEADDAAEPAEIDAIRAIASAIQAWEEGKYSGVKRVLGDCASRIVDLIPLLEAALDRHEVRREEAHALLALDQQRLDRFLEAVEEELTAARASSLAVLLSSGTGSESRRSEPEDARGRGSARPPSNDEDGKSTRASGEVPNFGLDRLVPRSFFITTDVLAEPEDLARDFVSALIRGEEGQITEGIVRTLANQPLLSLEEMATTLAAAIASVGPANPIVLTSSYQARNRLAAEALTKSEEHSRFVEVPVKLIHHDAHPFVAVLSADTGPLVELAPVARELESDRVFNELAVLAGVSEVPRNEMNDIVGRSKRTRIEEARLRGSVRVRLLEHLTVSSGIVPLEYLWRLPEGTW